MTDFNKDKFSTSQIVAGYSKAFIDSKVDSDPDFCPALISNHAGRKVLTAIEHELRNCDDMFMSVAFITSNGVAPLLGTLEELEAKKIKGRILTTDYLLFSEPKALDTLNNLSNIELRVYRTSQAGKGFHTKGYMFHKNGNLRVIVGSSNLTSSAVTKNYEWNTRIVSTKNGQFAADIENEFNDLWNSSVCYDDCREEYEADYQSRKTARDEINKLFRTLDLSYSKVLNPNAMQEHFVRNVEQLLLNGEKRAMLISATGTGKTFASAFAVRDIFAKSIISRRKVLFLSHREQINRQALKSYSRIFPKGVRMGLLSGNCNNVEEARGVDFLFATMQMMAKDSVREENFSKEEFSIIILDECHRSGAGSYRKIIDYFKPSLLLGMSASPERTDDFDVFSLFDHNIACEIRLQQALESDLLCPFHYFGITDLEVDNESLDVRDFGFLTSEKRVGYIISKAEYFGYSGDKVRGLVFCSSKAEARELSRMFNQTGKYRTIALSGEDSQECRENAVSRLVMKESDDCLDYIFTVDIFNEGVDIPEINQVIMLRPTESPIIFVQQLGRSLRKAEGKEYSIVLDFIANYDNNYMIPIALSGDRTGNKDNIRRSLMEGNNIITGASTIYFDEISKKRIYASLDSAKLNRIQLLRQEYLNLKYKLGRIPDLSEFDEYGELDPLRIIDACGSYHAFLVRYEPAYEMKFDPVQTEMLEFVSRKFASGKRPHELVLLELALNGSDNLISDWELAMDAGYGIRTDDNMRINVINVLTNEFFGIGAARDTFRNCIFLMKNADGEYGISDTFEDALEDDRFKKCVQELVRFGLSRYNRLYSSHEANSSFVIGRKYTYEDVCRLLNWRRNQVATNIGGYKFDEETRTYPVFINYNKPEEISETTKYEDRFLNPSNLIAISKSRRTEASNDVQMALKSVERGVRMDLFVRKNKDDKESKEFYYLGPIEPNGHVHQFNMPNTDATAVEIGYHLRRSVDANLYEYLTDTEL